MAETEEERAARRRDPAQARSMVEELYQGEGRRKEAAAAFVSVLLRANALNKASWSITLRGSRVALLFDGIWACALEREIFTISLKPGVLASADWAALQPKLQSWGTFKSLPGTEIFGIEVDLLSDKGLRSALDAASQAFLESTRQSTATVSQQRSHSPGVIEYLEELLGSTIPEPDFEAGRGDGPKDHTPPTTRLASGTLSFKGSQIDVSSLLTYLEMGDLALPDLQRPFVWPSSKVRDLLDSMYQGFPVGTLMIWNTQRGADGTRTIGVDADKRREPSMLVVDGQQRLTSLYAVLRGKTVRDEDFVERRIEIAFRPRDAKFEVTSEPIRRDPEWIPDIAELWAKGAAQNAYVNAFMARLGARRALTDADKAAIDNNLTLLFNLARYPFPTVEVGRDVKEEQVAEIFVRINNGCTQLKQADFILTLLSVHSRDTREALEDFAQQATQEPKEGSPSPKNPLIRPGPAQLLRTSVAVAFHRARLSAVYQLLRGKDPETETVSVELRDKQIEQLRTAVAQVLDLNNWTQFIQTLIGAGFRSRELISSETAVVNSYALFLIGRAQCGVEIRDLSRCIARWFFFASLTGRYSGSSETRMEEDLVPFRGKADANAFLAALEKTMSGALTNDYWHTTLPQELETSGSAPVALAFRAAQIKLGAPALFSDRRISELYDPQLRGTRKSLEEHHLFPRRFLALQGIHETKRVNQAANLAQVEWPDMQMSLTTTRPSTCLGSNPNSPTRAGPRWRPSTRYRRGGRRSPTMNSCGSAEREWRK